LLEEVTLLARLQIKDSDIEFSQPKAPREMRAKALAMCQIRDFGHFVRE